MRKNWFGMLLVLGISLAPLYEAAADGCIPEAGCILEDSSVPESKQSTGAAVETSSGAYTPEISTKAVEALAPAALPEVSTDAAVAVSVDTGAVALATGTMTAVSSGTEKLADYFTIEMPALQEAGQAKLAEWQQELQNNLSGIDKVLRAMADDRVVTSGEFFDLEKALRSYDGLLSDANKELAFYRLSIPEDEKIKVYWRLHNIEQRHILGDDRRKSVRRFFFNLTGKDVRVKVNVEDIVGRTFLAPLAIPFIVILEATGN